MASTELRVSALSRGTPETVITAGERVLRIDEPPFFGGSGSAPSPVDTLLAAVAGCVSAAGHWIAGEMGITLKTLETQISGTINADGFFGKPGAERSGFQKIRIDIQADAEWTETEKSRWLEAVRTRCPVLDNLTGATPVLIQFSGDKQ